MRVFDQVPVVHAEVRHVDAAPGRQRAELVPGLGGGAPLAAQAAPAGRGRVPAAARRERARAVDAQSAARARRQPHQTEGAPIGGTQK